MIQLSDESGTVLESVDEAEETYTVRLKSPVVIAGGKTTVTSLVVRKELSVHDLEAMDKGQGNVGRMVYLLAELTGASLTVIRNMKPSDFTVATQVAGEILGKAL